MSANPYAVRPVRLELLREGPAHNQLLSPLARYLALVENRPAESFFLQLEHRDLLDAQRAIEHAIRAPAEAGSTGDEFAVRTLRTRVSEALLQVRGAYTVLTAADAKTLVHLRLVLSASELASVPWELAESAPGVSLLLRAPHPVVITRESRREGKVDVRWPARPKILFAFTDFPEHDVPWRAHLQALYNALAPWIRWSKDEGVELRKHLVTLRAASTEDIARACAEGGFTHVHVLAHGAPHGPDRALAAAPAILLHDPGDRRRAVAVDGERLEASLRTRVAGLASPTVVTLSVCHGGAAGSVVSGASGIAHVLHRAGIAFVVASQFPLSFQGSAVMAELLYEGLLVGRDPRVLLYELRRTLAAARDGASPFDAESLVAYMTVPPDLDVQLEAVRSTARMFRADVAVYALRTALEGGSDDAVGAATRELDAIELELAQAGSDRGTLGRRASIVSRYLEVIDHDNRDARVRTARGDIVDATATPLTARTPPELRALAARLYRAVFRDEPRALWGAIQAILFEAADGQTPSREELTAVRWLASTRLASGGADATDARVALAIARLLEVADAEELTGALVGEVHTLYERVVLDEGAASFRAFSEVRVLRRYATMLSRAPLGDRWRVGVAAARAVLERLAPFRVPYDWADRRPSSPRRAQASSDGR